jgi:hypothetical protein
VTVVLLWPVIWAAALMIGAVAGDVIRQAKTSPSPAVRHQRELQAPKLDAASPHERDVRRRV